MTLRRAPDDLVRLNVAGQELGVNPRTVKKYCVCGVLKCRKLPTGQWRVYRSSIEAVKRSEPTRTDAN